MAPKQIYCHTPGRCFVDFACSPKFLGKGALQPHESFSIAGLLWIHTSKAPWGTPLHCSCVALFTLTSGLSPCWNALSLKTNITKPKLQSTLRPTTKTSSGTYRPTSAFSGRRCHSSCSARVLSCIFDRREFFQGRHRGCGSW